jgi:heat shock protein HtpX
MWWILRLFLLCLGVGVVGAVVSSYLSYILVKRGVSVSKAIKVAAISTGVFVAIALIPTVLFVVGFAGILGFAGIAIVVLYLLIQYLIAPFVFISNTRKIELGSEYGWVLETAQRIAQRMGYGKKFDVRIADVETPNAFAIGNVLKRAIVVHRGSLQVLDRDEVEAVLAHELGHLVHRDNAYLLTTSFTPMITYLIGVSMIVVGHAIAVSAGQLTRYGRSDDMGRGLVTLFGLGIMIAGIATIVMATVVNLAVLAFSRIREHLADLYAVRATGSDTIAKALEKIEKVVSTYRTEEKKLIPKPELRNMLYIVPQLTEPTQTFFSSILSTHPPTSIRIFIAKKYLEELTHSNIVRQS